ncbi:protocatechuate 3,4-dioxygenase [Blastopirellula sp. JC732]|uniref:Protocatechuate 3,4-dioxygenase n=1 Tax=Blastopirellula sediminis TaxID=2894196 RepID=A0A9X1SE64_9BACT|nr:protocatechuate 3,4-dioxygenase [Blastopirellula sediminis]MCC9604313.1 protocatechuate 3,4-dioxygenase [Blastopirellula sediminis]MCC9626833.1 protocatechuate 3,4-dioxygenase [Blastopirellula sediminis]
MNQSNSFSRRRWMAGAFGIACFTTRGLFADYLFPSPSMTEGPFYPDKMPLDQDNDLIIIGDSLTPAVGEITHLTGRVLSTSGEPIRNATVEIWQCDANAVYLHTADSRTKQSQQDKNFQGFGRFETASTGEYRFRTIKPVPYPGRPAGHIHAKVKVGGREVLTTQIFVRGAEGNARDGIYRSAGDVIDRELVTADFTPVPGSKIGELAASFDFVIGRTPDDRNFPSTRRAPR